MQRDLTAPVGAPVSAWQGALMHLAMAWGALFGVTFAEWREMAHQWWDIDTYNHILLVPPVLAWLVWLRRDELAKVAPQPWSPGIAVVGAGLALCLCGRALDVNLFAQAGAVGAMAAAVAALLGARVAVVLAFPLAYAAFLVPFGDELIPALQHVTAQAVVVLTHLFGVPAIIDGLSIDTPGGKFLVAEECSGVKFLIAMVALTVLVGWTGMSRWRPRIVLVVAAALVSVAANAVRAWATIFVAQWVGAEKAGGFDHIVYGWIFFALVIALVLGAAWRHFDRDPADAGLTAGEAAAFPLGRFDRVPIAPVTALVSIAVLAIGFAALGLVV